MTTQFPVKCLLLTAILICIFITWSNAYSEKCKDFFDPIKCQIKKNKCFIKREGTESDCQNAELPIGRNFIYNIEFKNGDNYTCQDCCCHAVTKGLKSYNNSCPDCVILWSKSQENGIIEFSGSRAIMKEAIAENNEKLLKILVTNEFPMSIVLYPEEEKTRCKFDANNNDTWTIVASNQNWKDFFEESIIDGFIIVKHPNIQTNMNLAIKRKDFNKTNIHFLNVSVDPNGDKSTCLANLESPKSTTLPTENSSKSTTESQTITDANTHTIYTITSEIPNIISTTSSIINNSTQISFRKSQVFIPKAINVEHELEKELNMTHSNKPNERIKVVANFVGKHKQLKANDLSVAVKELDKIKNIKIKKNTTKDFTQVVDKVISTNNMKSWENLQEKENVQPSNIMNATDSYLKEASKYSNDEAKEIQKKNLILKYGKVSKKRVHILQSYKVSLNARVNIPQRIFQSSSSQNIRYSFVYYESLAIVMKTVATFRKRDDSQSKRLHSPILSISVYPQLTYPLKENINFTLNHNKRSNYGLICAYWDFSYKSPISNFRGRWETNGCHVVSQNQTCTTCSCNHLTNFALLMSIHRKVTDNKLTTVLSLISGGISILTLLLTIVCYISLWPNLTQNPVNRSRAIILMNLCFALLTANIIFLAARPEYATKDVCKGISALLHFFYLAVFFSMLMEGIDMFITVILVFSKKVKAKWFVLGTWGFPLLIVGISLPIRFHDYVDPDHCWLSVEKGVRWAFIGPAAVILIINTIILVIVISRMLRTQEMMQKTVKERARSGIRGIIILTPILGFTWVTGFILINKNKIFEYIFIISHCLQGVFIFLLHCLFSRQVREGFCQWLQKKNYLNEFSNSTLKCAVLDQTNVTRTMSTAQSLDDLDSYQQKLSDFQPRKSQDYLIPGK